MNKSWSYWERLAFPQEYDLIVVGAGFTGLSAALHVQEQHPDWRILVLERDILAEGASSKNAGFACYGTIGEILSDIELMGREEALQLVVKRWQGLNFLKALVPEQAMDFQQYGGTEIFLDKERKAYEKATQEISGINAFFKEAGIADELYQLSTHYKGLKAGVGSIFSPLEAQLNPLKALMELESKAVQVGITILRGVEVQAIDSKHSKWSLNSNQGSWLAPKVLFCTNAFGLVGNELDIVPARNQVLITKPLEHRLPPGNYHAKEGYIYFRTVGDRLLIGGARHLAMEEETTAELGTNPQLIRYLGQYLDDILALGGQWELEQQWSGIIATGKSKKPITQEIEPGLWFCGRFGGMGIALSAQQGREVALKLEAD